MPFWVHQTFRKAHADFNDKHDTRGGDMIPIRGMCLRAPSLHIRTLEVISASRGWPPRRYDPMLGSG